jgi:hypothetical protein
MTTSSPSMTSKKAMDFDDEDLGEMRNQGDDYNPRETARLPLSFREEENWTLTNRPSLNEERNQIESRESIKSTKRMH